MATENICEDGVYRLFFAVHPTPTLVYDPVTLRFLEVNDAAIQLYGYGRDEFQTITLATICPSGDVSRFKAIPKVVSPDVNGDESRERGVWKHRKKDGTLLDVQIVTTILPYQNAEAHFAMVTDVTEQLRVQEQVHLRGSAFKASFDAVVLVDMRLPDWPIISVNPAFVRMTGYEAHEVLGRNCRFLQGIDANQPERERIRQALRTGEPVSVVLRNYRKDGTLYHNELHLGPIHDLNGAVTHYVGVQHDITERKQAEEETRYIMRSARCFLWSAIVSEIGEPSLRWDFVHYDTEAAQRFLPLMVGPGEAYLEAAYRNRHPEDKERTDLYGNAQLRAGRDYSQEFRCKDVHGYWRWHHEDVHGEPLGPGRWRVVGVTTDITERKDAEERQARLRSELEEAARRQRGFIREVLTIATEGRFHLCNSEAELPRIVSPISGSRVMLTKETLADMRRAIRGAAESVGLPMERAADLILGAGEAAMNAVVHGGGGMGTVYTDPERGLVQVWIADQGRGIQEDLLHRATLERGWSTTGTQGQGFWMMLQSCDRIWLLTSPNGTTVVLEQEQ